MSTQKTPEEIRAYLREKNREQFTLTTDLALDETFEDIEWLWPGYIPRGFVTALVAPPGQGKSTIALSLCKTLLEGGVWPDGTPCEAIPEDQKLLWIDTEEKLQVFRQRLIDWEMPRGRFIFPVVPTREFVLDHLDDRDWINGVTEKFLPPIVVIDSLTTSRTVEGGALDMREVMGWLGRLAQRTKTTFIVIHHLNKGNPAKPVSIQRCRAVIAHGCASVIALNSPVLEEPEEHRLEVIKMNVARIPAPLGFTIHNDGPRYHEAARTPSSATMTQQAVEFLREILLPGCRDSKDVLKLAAERGISNGSLQRAKEILGVSCERRSDMWVTYLPGHERFAIRNLQPKRPAPPDEEDEELDEEDKAEENDETNAVPPPHNPTTSPSDTTNSPPGEADPSSDAAISPSAEGAAQLSMGQSPMHSVPPADTV